MSTPQELKAAHEKALAVEYGTYVAVLPIDLDGARAFNPGHPVPVSHVERGVVDKSLVAKVGTKAADAVSPAAPTTTS